MRRLLAVTTMILLALALLALPAFGQGIDDTGGDFYEPPLPVIDVEPEDEERTGRRLPSRSREPGDTGVLGSAPDALADTGMGVSVGAALAIGLVVLGGGALLVARRRDRSAA